MRQRTYDLDQANQALPVVRRLVGRLVELVGWLPELEDDRRVAAYRAGRTGAAAGENERLERATIALQSAEDDCAAALHGLEELGIRIKDARMGLVDFLSYREDELVELCWKLGEDQVAYWHHIGEGYAGRKPL